MSDEQSQRYLAAKAIVHDAMDLPASERTTFIDERCAGDEALREEARWLLQTMETENDPFLDHDPLRAVEPDADEVVQVQTPRNYRILRRLGEGGYGVVFLAERSDGQYRQQVALKLLNFAGQLSPSRQARFRAEGQILAQLNHTNIAHLIDAGALPDGRPFLAMEFVDGTTLTRYCEERALDLRERIALFLKICDAVGYAHQRLVIHRDLKPANLVVTDQGEPKLLDFGIARLLGPQEYQDLPPTEDGQRLLTLVYASPEQIRGEPLSTVSDIYSLGVLLYELLTGTPPFIGDLHNTTQLSRDICETEPVRPSRRTSHTTSSEHASGRTLRTGTTGRRSISPDLDAITLKALRKRPEDRYDSARALSDDLKRFLSSRPVLARKGHLAYRARRYLQRHRWGVAAAATFVVMIVGFAANRQIELQRTQLERDKARQVADFMSELFANADPFQSKGESVTVREMLDRGARELSARDGLDPALKGSMLSSIGNAYNGLGLSKEAASALTAALDAYGQASASAAERAQAYAWLGESYGIAGDYKAAVASFDEALRLPQVASGDHADAITDAEISRAHYQILAADTPLEPIISELENKVRALEARQPPTALLSNAYDALGLAHESNTDYVAAAASHARAIKAATAFYGANSAQALLARRSHARVTVHVDPAKGAQLLKAWLDDHRRLVGERNMAYAIALNDLAVALNNSDQDEEAIPVYQEARAVARDVAGPSDRYYLHLSTNLARQLIDFDRQEEAVAILRENLPVLATRVDTGIDRLGYAQALGTMGVALEQRDDAGAERSFAQAERALGAEGPTGYFNVYEGILYRLTKARIKLRRFPEAEASLAKLQEIEAKLPADADRRSQLLRIDLLLAQARYDEATRLSAAGLTAIPTPKACSEFGKRMQEQYALAVEKGGRAAEALKLPECKAAS